jgi:formimidoylglutamate deiminase
VRRERGLLAPDGQEGTDALAARLLGFATAGGMRSLGRPGGTLAPGDPADFVSFDLADPSIAGTSAGDLLPTVVFSAARTAVRDVVIGGRPALLDGAPPAGRPAPGGIVAGFTRTMRKLWE